MSTRNRSRAGSAAGYLMNMVPNTGSSATESAALEEKTAAAATATATRTAGEGSVGESAAAVPAATSARTAGEGSAENATTSIPTAGEEGSSKTSTATQSTGEWSAAMNVSASTSTGSIESEKASAKPETTSTPADSSSPEKAAAKANRMCLAVYPENALYLEAVTTMRGTNKTALINEAIAAMRANDSDWDALKAAYEMLTAFRK